jgi:phosphoribosylaminoimidazolecarboxamide formyltransferase/IMP cyclohydrolase
VTAVCDPADYAEVAAELADSREVSLGTRLRLARKVFAVTSRYDGVITMTLERLSAQDGQVKLGAWPVLPERMHAGLIRRQEMRYGENPHQAAALYVSSGLPLSGLAGAQQLQGKELSYNNLVDLDAAWKLAREFERPAAAIIKHNNPCGAAEQAALRDAYVKAFECDPVSAYGGVVAFNRELDGATAAELAKLFVECVVAPGYEPAAREALAGKKNLRLMQMPEKDDVSPYELKQISGGVLVQQPDMHRLSAADLKTATKRAPTEAEVRAMLFAWKVCKHVKSNAIVFAVEGQALGIGAGQMSRVDSVRLAVMKAQKPLAGTVVASDAFFPFPDGVEEAARAGVTAVIQPGGSVRDAEVIAAADRAGMAMVFTGVRHFRH